MKWNDHYERQTVCRKKGLIGAETQLVGATDAWIMRPPRHAAVTRSWCSQCGHCVNHLTLRIVTKLLEPPISRDQADQLSMVWLELYISMHVVWEDVFRCCVCQTDASGWICPRYSCVPLEERIDVLNFSNNIYRFLPLSCYLSTGSSRRARSIYHWTQEDLL